jgi:hypothetical protein
MNVALGDVQKEEKEEGFHDYSLVTTWERFVATIEECLRLWTSRGGVDHAQPSPRSVDRVGKLKPLVHPSPPNLLSVCLSVLQHGPRVSLGCRSNEFLDHAKT